MYDYIQRLSPSSCPARRAGSTVQTCDWWRWWWWSLDSRSLGPRLGVPQGLTFNWKPFGPLAFALGAQAVLPMQITKLPHQFNFPHLIQVAIQIWPFKSELYIQCIGEASLKNQFILIFIFNYIVERKHCSTGPQGQWGASTYAHEPLNFLGGRQMLMVHLYEHGGNDNFPHSQFGWFIAVLKAKDLEW